MGKGKRNLAIKAKLNNPKPAPVIKNKPEAVEKPVPRDSRFIVKSIKTGTTYLVEHEHYVDRFDSDAVRVQEYTRDGFDNPDENMLLRLSMRWDGCHNFDYGNSVGMMHGCSWDTPEIMADAMRIALMLTAPATDDYVEGYTAKYKPMVGDFEEHFIFTEYSEEA